MTLTKQIPFTIHPIPGDVLDDVRSSGVGEAGTGVVSLCAAGGEPLRCCLRDARAGEDIVLFAYSLPLPSGPYRETGPVYAHRDDCGGPPDSDSYPYDWRDRPQVLRAYDERGRIHEASRTHDGRDPVGEIARVLAEPGVVAVHSRNIAYGCFMFAATREPMLRPSRR